MFLMLGLSQWGGEVACLKHVKTVRNSDSAVLDRMYEYQVICCQLLIPMCIFSCENVCPFSRFDKSLHWEGMIGINT